MAVLMDTQGLEDMIFGDEFREKEMCLRPESVFLNNGSYGTVPHRVMEVQKRLMDERESHPDHWFRCTANDYWLEARKVVAQFVGADEEDVVFVSNATTAVNVVMRSLKLQPGDAILATTLTYGSLRYLWDDLQERIYPEGVENLVLEIKFPVESEDHIVKQYDDFLASHPNVKLVLIDHITSPSAVLMPIERLVPVCHKHGAMVMVDGAHAPGHVQLNLNALNADFYAGNLHKWLFTPRGCAILWVRRDHHQWVSPPNTSWAKGKSLGDQFFQQGTEDHIPFLCAKYSLQFYQAIGGMEKVVGYTSKLATEGCEYLHRELGLGRLAVPPSMVSPNMRLLRFPDSYSEDTVERVVNELYFQSDIQAAFGKVDGAMYLRISVQVYNTFRDFQKLASGLQNHLGVPDQH